MKVGVETSIKICKFIIFLPGQKKKRWEIEERTETPKKVKEHENTGDKLNEEGNLDKLKGTLKHYGKAFSTAEERGLFAKIPSLLLKMGTCHKQIAMVESDIVHKLGHTRIGSRNIGMAIESSIINKSCSQSEEWVQKAVKEAQEVAEYYLDTLVPQLPLDASGRWKPTCSSIGDQAWGGQGREEDDRELPSGQDRQGRSQEEGSL